MDCIFCKIASGEFSSNTVFENEGFRVILDIAPANAGHCLVLPKKHAKDIFELDEETLKEGFAVAKRVAEAIKNAYGVSDINILQNNGEAAGQTVGHFHIHVIPRKAEDSVVIKADALKFTDDEFAAIREEISKNI